MVMDSNFVFPEPKLPDSRPAQSERPPSLGRKARGKESFGNKVKVVQLLFSDKRARAWHRVRLVVVPPPSDRTQITEEGAG